MKPIFAFIIFAFSVNINAANLTIKAKKSLELNFVAGCILNTQSAKTTCIRSSVASEDTGELNADGTPIFKDVPQGIFSFDLPAGRYIPYLKVTGQGITYQGQKNYSSNSYLLSSSSLINVSIFANKGISISSVCDNFNGTYTIHGSGFSSLKGLVQISGLDLYSSNLPVWNDSLIVISPPDNYPVLPLTVVSKENGSSALYFLPAGQSLPYCVFK